MKTIIIRYQITKEAMAVKTIYINPSQNQTHDMISYYQKYNPGLIVEISWGGNGYKNQSFIGDKVCFTEPTI